MIKPLFVFAVFDQFISKLNSRVNNFNYKFDSTLVERIDFNENAVRIEIELLNMSIISS